MFLLTSLAQEESLSISENTAWGIRKRFADGKYFVAYSTFLGYDRGTEKGQFVINQGQAAEYRSGPGLYSSLFTCGICGCWYGAKVEHSNDKYRRVMMMCRRRFKAPYYCRNTRIDKEDIPKLFIEAVRRLCLKYPAIKRTCIAVMKEAGVRAGLQVKNSYIHDMQDLTMIVSSATVYPDKTVKIELIDSTKMKLRL